MKKAYQYLVIDDDPTSNLICDFIIKRFNQEAVVKIYKSPEEALNFIHINQPNLAKVKTVIFLDINMPTMTGFEFLNEFEKFTPEKKYPYKVYMLTSSIEDFSSQTKKYPMVKGFLSKPLKVSYLEKIHQQLEKEAFH